MSTASSSIQEKSVVEIRQLTRKFGATAALTNISLEIPRGSVFGLIGENGAGKTTLIKHILGMYRAQTGAVRVFGLNPVRDPVAVLGRIGYLSEDRDLPEWMRISELMSYTQAFFPTWDEAYAEEIREMFDLDRQAKIKNLSRGQRARAGLLTALAHRPDFLVLDEPSSGLDPIVRRDILGAIVRTIADEGRTVLFSSHLLDEVERVADRAAILRQGRLLLTAPMDEIKTSRRRVTLRFNEPKRLPPALLGTESIAGYGVEWTYVCGADRDTLHHAAAALQATVVEDAPLSLDEIFVAHLAS